jgi:hypothetical protein
VQPLLQWKSNEYYTTRVCICSLRYRACNAHASYCHQWPARLYNVFPYYLINDTIFATTKNFENKMRVSSFSTTCVRNFFILRTTERDMTENVCWSSCKVPYILNRFLVTLEFSRQIFEKSSNIKFHENPLDGSRVVPCGRTGGTTDNEEANSRLSQFCERV